MKAEYIVIIAAVFAFIFSQPRSNKKYVDDLKRQKDRAMRPPVDKSLLHAKPEKGQLMLGKYKGKYVTYPVTDDGNCLILGGSGSGKSANYIIDDLLMNDGDDCTVCCVDIKGELSFKTQRLDNPAIEIFDPQDHSTIGFDPFYRLSDNPTEQEKLETMRLVAESMIKIDNSTEAYWSLSARSMLTSLLLYHYDSGYDNLPDIISAIMSMPIKQEIAEIVNNCEEGSVTRKLIMPYYDLADDTLTSIFSSINIAVNAFFDSNIVWALRDAPRKTNPLHLESGKSLFLRIKEESLSAYSLLISLILNMILTELSRRPENAKKVLLVIDELPRLIGEGSIGMLPKASLTIRSRRVSLILVTQSLAALEGGFKKPEISTLIANCSTKIILDCSARETANEVLGWIPKYTQIRSTKPTGGKTRNGNVSFDEKARVDSADLMNLISDGEAIIIHKTGYYRVKKVPYFADKYLKPQAEAIRRHNEKYFERRSGSDD